MAVKELKQMPEGNNKGQQLLTFPQLLSHHCREYPTEVAWRQKDFGVWQAYTWQDIYDQVKYFCLGLISLGLERGDKVSIIGDNDRHWFWAELAVQAGGGVSAGIFVDCLPAEVKHIITHSDSKFIVAQDQEQVDKLLRIKSELPLVKKIIYWDPSGLKYYDDPLLMSWDEVSQMGRECETKSPELFEESITKGDVDDIAVILYTSGTSSLPKGALGSYRFLINCSNQLPFAIPAEVGDDYLSATLPGWLVEQVMGLGWSLLFRTRMNFPESADTVKENIIELCPKILLYPSRIWEAENSIIQVKINDTAFIKRFIFNLFLPVGYKVTELKRQGYKIDILWKTLRKIGDMLVFRSLRSRHGLHNSRTPITAGAILGPDIYLFLRAIGLELRQLYGSSEGGNIAIQTQDDIKFDSTGRPTLNTEVRIADNSEILARSDASFISYYKDPDATKKTLDSAGFVHTGDAGYLDDGGQVIFMDRLADIRELKGGVKFAPQYMESRLKFSPFIKDALIIESEDLSEVAALICIDFLNVGDWAERRHITYTTFLDLSQRPEVRRLLCGEVRKANRNLPPETRLKKFVNMYKDFDADEAELTRTKKLRRGALAERYREILDALFSDQSEVNMETVVTYQDGKTRQLDVTVHVETVGDV